MTGITALEKTLIGVESSPGASTDQPTTHLRGIGKLKDTLEIVYPKENVGIIGGTARSYIPKTGSEFTWEGDATFEQICYLRNAGIYGVGSTTDGSGQVRTWNVQKTSTDPIASTDLYTLVVESGDNQAVETAHFLFCSEYTLSGKYGEAMQISATFPGQAPSTDTFTAVGSSDLSNPAESIMFSNGKLYIDPSTDTVGTTLASTTLLEVSLKHTTGWVINPATDGRTDFTTIKHIADEIMLDVTFEHNSVAVAEKAAWRNQTERAIQVRFTGSTLTSAGTYTTKMDIWNLYGKWEKFGADGLEDVDGDNTYTGTFKVVTCERVDAKAQFINVNELAVLP